jgi:hypothetical protein
MAANTASMGMNISELAEQRGVRECLQWINEAHLQLCRVPAPTFLEQERAQWFLEQLRAAGWDATSALLQVLGFRGRLGIRMHSLGYLAGVEPWLRLTLLERFSRHWPAFRRILH